MTTVMIRRRGTVWTALLAVVVYIAIAAGLGNFFSGLAGEDQPIAEFALGHLGALPIAIVLLLLYVRWTGNDPGLW
ncbi:hypothetical protein ACLRGI_07910 [Paenarthrobacter nitroguajacolicus]|uniref:hypothetical protein n=1 Tax=Paenarthrobacter nitroguajacolicus TaxID=211146 RepID=UPI003AEBA1B1